MPLRRAVISGLMLLALAAETDAKTGPKLHTPEQVQRIRKLARDDPAYRQRLDNARQAAASYMAMSDEEIWQFVPSHDLPRALNVRFGHGCPICGVKIFRVGGHYPWILRRDRPFKVQCPICKRVFPTNDFAAYLKSGRKAKLDTTAEFVDDGFGWRDKAGNRYWFVGVYVFWRLWTDIIDGPSNLADAYLWTGDRKYAHKAAVLLARIGQEYPKMVYAKQAYHNGKWPAGIHGRIRDYIWETGVMRKFATAYDVVYDALDDEPLKAFLAGKGIGDVKRHIEQHIIQEQVRDVLAGRIRGNMGMHQSALATVAAVWDDNDPKNGVTSKQMIAWILDGGGAMNDLLYNGVHRDGMATESVGYSAGWAVSFFRVAEALKRSGVDLYHNLKLKKMADFYLDLTVAGEWTPCVGDTGGGPLGTRRGGWSRYVMEQAFRAYADMPGVDATRFAQALAQLGGPEKDPLADPIDDKVNAIVAKHGKTFELGTRGLGGTGFAILEAGRAPYRRGLSLYYGYSTGGHGHRDTLNIELFAHGKVMLPEMGYPAHWNDKCAYWTTNTISHYTVLIDERQYANHNGGTLNLIAEIPGARIADASAERVYPGLAQVYRRSTMMIDASERDSYVVDVFRVRGGKQHDWSFHGPGFDEMEFVIDGVELSPNQMTGTLAGEDVRWGAAWKHRGSGFQYLENVKRASPRDGWSATWHSAEEDLGLRLTVPKGVAQEVIAADGAPEYKPGFPNVIKYVLVRNQADKAPLASTYVAIVEPYQTRPYIADVERVELTGGDAAKAEGQDSVAVRVRYGDREDIIYNATRPEAVRRTADGATLSGHFAVVRHQGGQLQGIGVVNGKVVSSGGFSLTGVAPARATIDRPAINDSGAILDARWPNNGALIGRTVLIDGGGRRTNYTIERMAFAGMNTFLTFADGGPVIARGRVDKTVEAEGLVTSKTPFTGYGHVYNGQFQGMYMVNERAENPARIKQVKHAKGLASFTLVDGDELIRSLKDLNGDGQTFFYVLDYDAGDRLTVPGTAALRRRSTHVFELASTTLKPISVGVPKELAVGDCRIRMNDGKWAALTFTPGPSDKQRSFAFEPRKFLEGRALFVLNRPATMALDDDEAPVASVTIGGKPVPLKDGRVSLGIIRKPPEVVHVRFRDDRSGIDPAAASVRLNGVEIRGEVGKVRVALAKQDPKQLDVEVRLGELPDGAYELDISVPDQAPTINRGRAVITFERIDPSNVALHQNGTTSKADSHFRTYDETRPVHDGNTHAGDAHCLNDVSWASAETPTPHWFELTFSGPRNVCKVNVWWAFFKGAHHTSTNCQVQAWVDGGWKTVATLKRNKPEAVSVATFKPVRTQKLRLYQPKGGGSAARPDLMWLAEIKVGGVVPD